MEQTGLELSTIEEPEPYRIDRADSTEWLSKRAPRSIDLIITDPAYESLEKHRKKGTTTRLTNSKASSNAWFPIFPNDRFEVWFQMAHRALKTNAHLYVLCDQETMFVVKPIAEAAGFRFWKPIVWDKRKIGMGYHYRARYEFILFFEKGERRLNDLGVPDVLEAPRVLNGYPTEKPVELLRVLVEQSSQPGELVVDPFAGSGSTGVAALLSGRRFWGCDIQQESLEVALPRLEATYQSVQGGDTKAEP